jgi:hypothetical protein
VRPSYLTGQRWEVLVWNAAARLTDFGGLAIADPAFVALVARLSIGCPEFADWWMSHDVGVPAAGAYPSATARRAPIVNAAS